LAGSDPGSVAAEDWYERNIANRLHDLDPAKTIIALGSYGYNWTEGEKDAMKSPSRRR